MVGWHFTGWNTKANGDGTTFADEQEVKTFNYDHNSEIELFVQWAPNEYYVCYNENQPNISSDLGGEYVPDQICYYDTSYNFKPNTFSYVSWNFSHWVASNGTKHNEGQSFRNLIANNKGIIYLNAQWVEKPLAE